MARIDSLAAEQKAVLQLILQQGKSYRDLAALLRIDEDAVRRRAHAAAAGLGPDPTPGLEDGRRDAITDFLLGQGSEAERDATRELLAGSAAGRDWARAVRDELRPMAGDALPEIPAERAETGAAADAAPSDTDAAPVPAGARASLPRSSRLGGALLLGLVAVVVAVVLVVVLGGGGNSGTGNADTASTAAKTTTTTTPQPVVKAQVNLAPPAKGAPAAKALGVVQIVDVSGQQAINAVVQGLPSTKKAGYGIWLYSSGGKELFLGYFSSADSQGRLIAQGKLSADISGYREMLVTTETQKSPPRPGTIYLRGPIKTA
ncbi:MAG: hypothetical protein JWO74_2377 [Solirubrobacterales bacterium]|jgi:hypothetical protein|nr:hypothetical protein [Solirubrobacterales bacterium]